MFYPLSKVENPQSFVTRQECDKIAFQNGFRRSHGETDGWRRYSSTTAQGSIWLAAEGNGNWLLALDHAGVLGEIGLEMSDSGGPGLARFRFASLTPIYAVMPRLYELAVSLPDAPLQEFLHRTSEMPRTTEAERLVVQRVGQDIFRDRLITYWQGSCPLTGISDQALLRASHIKPWKDCERDEDRLDVHNGLLLSALWDAAFDRGLVTFDDGGRPQYSMQLSEAATAELRWQTPIRLTDKHRARLEWHRSEVFEKGAAVVGQTK
ncbi:HNH endonuclease [uncultured Roseovarius sp.]|uniref:HNH endonuclease n=1 Tax=uncultured Roseovarius sp. TaxID=293344 RepID=UPI000C69ED2A|nr:restriction endonuclease [Roseovarius sp.]MAO01001.1 restriction endonuclease [Roseovarius sp.]MBD11256.1 restriction endonuclease [Roseovarius sp.]|tara:strand:+ start:1251 stop:2045 length:795 start_codon:yes stop_codon:yes gene_type:complete